MPPDIVVAIDAPHAAALFFLIVIAAVTALFAIAAD